MGPGASMLYSHEDPWRISAFIFVLTQLLLTVLVLAHTILVSITVQLMKWYGWWIPSCRSSVYGHCASVGFDSRVTKKPLNLDANCSPLISTERFLNRSQSEDCRSLKSKPLVCPKCHGVWTFKRGHLKNNRVPSSQWEETATGSDVVNSKSSPTEAGFRSKYGHNTQSSVDQLVCMQSCCQASNTSTEQSMYKACWTKTCDDANEAAYENSCFKPRNFTEDCANHVTTPISQTPANDDGMSIEGFIEEAGSSSKVLVGDGLDKVSVKTDEGLDKEVSAFPRRNIESNEYGSQTTINGCKDEEWYVVMSQKGDSESLTKALRQAIQNERKKLCAVYAELEVERIASETAANEAMSMISRLQEEKAALQMQAAHYQRMAEERASYDEQAMQLLKEILYRKERDNYLLDKEIKVIKTRVSKDVKKFGKKRHDVAMRSFSAKYEDIWLRKNVEEASNLTEGSDTRNGVQKQNSVGVIASVKTSPYSFQTTEEQPLKRLKGINDNESVTSQGINLVSDAAYCALVEGNDQAQNYSDAFPHESVHIQESIKSQQSVVVTTSRISKSGPQKQVYEKMPTAFENGGRFSEVFRTLDWAQSASAMASELESYHFVANSNENQNLLSQDGKEAQLVPLYNVSKATQVHKSGEWSHNKAEGVCSIKGTSDFITSCSSNGVASRMSFSEASSSATPCATTGPETLDHAGDKLLQYMNFDLKDHSRKDLQTKLQVCESDMMPQS